MAKQIVIIGGGASGLTAAIFAARAGASVTLLERNERPGRKLLATGNGRCNLTNLNQSRLCYRGEDPDRAFQIISRFNVQRTIGFFSDLGLYTRNREGWIYPYTGQALLSGGGSGPGIPDHFPVQCPENHRFFLRPGTVYQKPGGMDLSLYWAGFFRASAAADGSRGAEGED